MGSAKGRPTALAPGATGRGRGGGGPTGQPPTASIIGVSTQARRVIDEPSNPTFRAVASGLDPKMVGVQTAAPVSSSSKDTERSGRGKAAWLIFPGLVVPGGCLHREDVGDMLMGGGGGFTAECHPDPMGPSNVGPITLAGNDTGDAFVLITQSASDEGLVYEQPNGAMTLERIGAGPVRTPLGADAGYVYARASAASEDGLVVIRRSDGQQVTKIGTSPIASIDASHPDCVSFTQYFSEDNNVLYRWRKLPD